MSEEKSETMDTKQYYVLGIVVLIAVVAAGYFMRPKVAPGMTTPTDQAAVVPTPTPGPITALICDTQYYNPKIGFPEYYLTVEGGDVSEAKKVDCTFTASVDDKAVATTKVSSPLTEKPQRGGATFRCSTKAIALTPEVVTLVDVKLTDDLGNTASCSAPFTLPAP